jgi:hypothetical protein
LSLTVGHYLTADSRVSSPFPPIRAILLLFRTDAEKSGITFRMAG